MAPRGDAGEEPVEDQALRMVDRGEGPGTPDDPARLRALAWALRDLGYATWSTDPPRVEGVAEALDRLVAHAASARAGPDVVAEIVAFQTWIAGIADLAAGRMTAAAARFEIAGAGFTALSLPREAALTQVPKIMALSVLGRHADAAVCGEEALLALRRLGDRAAASRVSLNLGNLYCRCSDYPRALGHYREAAVLFARVGDRERSIMSDIGMADALASTGDFDEALRIYARARMRAGQHGFPVLLAMVEESVALVALARGAYRPALAGLEQSRRGYEALGMPQHLATAEKQLADAYLELRLLPEALALFDQALQRFEALEMPVERAWALTQKGRTLLLLGRPKAVANDALLLAARLFAEQEVTAGEATVLLARAELALGEAREAEAIDLATLASFRFDAARVADGQARSDAVRGRALLASGRAVEARAQFAATLARARDLGLLSLEVACLAGQGSAALAAGEEAAARTAFEAAIAGFEEQRDALPDDAMRGVFLSDHLRPYEELLRLALAAHAADRSDVRAADALRALERFRSRVLDDRLGGRRPRDDATADASTVALRARLNWLYRRLRRNDEDGDDSVVLAAEAHRSERELLERARRSRFAATSQGEGRNENDTFDPARLRAALGVDEALVEYGVVDDRLFAFVVTRDRIDLVHDVAAWPDVIEAVKGARFQIETLRHGAAPVERHLDVLTRRTQARLASLHGLVWAPIDPLVRASRHLVVVPHGLLASLPFAALHDGKKALLDRHSISIAPSAQVAIRTLSRTPASPRAVLAIGESSHLLHAADEALAVASRFPVSVALVGEAATLQNLRQHAAAADVIHLACHAEFRADNPMFSALHLSDGALTADQVEDLPLDRKTMVLSACETGLAECGSGDEMTGLVRGFLLAGAARVLATLWPVDDAATEAFMAMFYGGLLAGEGAGHALVHAQQRIRETHPHAAYWAAFVLYGGS